MTALSVVVPVRDEAGNVAELVRRLEATLTGLRLGYEIIFVTDRNRDNTFEVLRDLSRRDERVRVLKLSNAFGHHVAVVAGLAHAQGAAVVVMDGDLQDHPEDIPRLYAKLREGFDQVYGIKERKNESALRNLLSKGFLRVFRWLSDFDLDFNTGMFRIVSRRVVDEVLRFKERDPSLTFIMGFLGFPTARVPVTSGERHGGQTKYPLRRQLSFALSSLMSFSTRPLRLIAIAGLVISGLSLVYLVIVLLQQVVLHVPVPGWTTLVVLLTFLGGAILFAQGITAEYIARIFLETKNRPLYAIEERVGWPAAPAAGDEKPARSPPLG